MSPPTTRQNLYPGEELSVINDAPCITYFRRGAGGGGDDDPSTRPLVVLIPGAAHLARVFYGGHEGHDECDFLAHWLTTRPQNYHFLAVSYPIDTSPDTSVMPTTDPGMTVSQWGEQAVEATKRTIRRQNLGGTVILVFWSMGGKILQPFCLAAQAQNIVISFAVPLVATPAVRGIRDRPVLTPSPTTGYATPAAGLSESYFVMQLHEQNALHGDRIIIPDEIYRREYLGGFPVGLGCYGVRWSGKSQRRQEEEKGRHSFVDDPDIGYEVADRFPLGKLPLMCPISCSSPVDLRHSVADKYTWGFLLTYKLLGGISPSKKLALQRTDTEDQKEKGKRLTRFIHAAPETLSATVEGGHHFFIGVDGARRTAELIKDFETRVTEFQRDLEELLA